MDKQELKSLQAPLKDRYRSDPGAAQITLKARSRIGDSMTCSVETGKTMAKAGLHPATGGDGLSVCSGDMLLEALAACAGVTLNAVATSTGFRLDDAIIHTEGDLDFRGTLAVDKSVPVGFSKIRLRFQLETNEPKESIDNLVKLTERYCVVYQTLLKGNNIEVSVA